MKKQTVPYEKNGYLLRLAQPEDAEHYYEEKFNPLDAEVARLTGSCMDFTRKKSRASF